MDTPCHLKWYVYDRANSAAGTKTYQVPQSARPEWLARCTTKLLTFEETCRLVVHHSSVVRANAAAHLIVFADDKDAAEGILKLMSINPDNRVHLMGTISVAHVAVACLLRMGTRSGTATANELVQAWPEPDRSDLIWYLRSEEIWK